MFYLIPECRVLRKLLLVPLCLGAWLLGAIFNMFININS